MAALSAFVLCSANAAESATLHVTVHKGPSNSVPVSAQGSFSESTNIYNFVPEVAMKVWDGNDGPPPGYLTVALSYADIIAVGTNSFSAFTVSYYHQVTEEGAWTNAVYTYEVTPSWPDIWSEKGGGATFSYGDSEPFIDPFGDYLTTKKYRYLSEWRLDLEPPPNWPRPRPTVRLAPGIERESDRLPVVWESLAHPGMVFKTQFGTALDSYGSPVAADHGTNGYAELSNPISTSSALGFCRIVVTNSGGSTTNYSTNLTGYALMTFPQGKTAFANPFDKGDIRVSSLFPDATEGMGVLQHTYNFSFVTNLFTSGGWTDPDMPIRRGKGFIFLNPNSTTFTNLFYGDVPDGASQNTPSGFYSFIANKIPRAGYLLDLGFLTDDDTADVYIWNGSSWLEASMSDSEWTGDTGMTVDSEKGPWIGVGQPFIYRRYGSSDPSWDQTFIP